MKDFLKHIGIPVTLASTVACGITAAFFIFQVDSRYAKADAVSTTNGQTLAKLEAVSNEVNKLNGAVQVLIQVSTKVNQDQQAVLAHRDRSRYYDPYEDMVGGPASPPETVADAPLPRPTVTPSVATVPALPAPPPTAPVAQAAESLNNELIDVKVPKVSVAEINNADPKSLQELLDQTDTALKDSQRNLRTIQAYTF